MIKSIIEFDNKRYNLFDLFNEHGFVVLLYRCASVKRELYLVINQNIINTTRSFFCNYFGEDKVYLNEIKEKVLFDSDK